MTIQEIIDRQGGSLEELRQYASSRGLYLPLDLNYQLTNKELTIINNYGKEEEIFEPRKTILSGPKIIGTIDVKSIDVNKQRWKTNHTQTRHKQKNDNIIRLIGIVKFYDSDKGFGFISTNWYGLSTKPEDEKKLFDFYFRGLESDEGDIVIFTPDIKQNKAINVKHITNIKNALNVAMKYRGKYAKIIGRDLHKPIVYNRNVINSVLSSFANISITDTNISFDINKISQIAEAFCEFVNGNTESTIEELFDNKIFRLILYLAFHYADKSTINPKLHQEFDAIKNKVPISELSIERQILMYKYGYVSPIDENFIIYYQDKFSFDDINHYVLSSSINHDQKYKISVSYMKFLFEQKDTKSMTAFKNTVKDALSESFKEWETTWSETLSDADKYQLWCDKIISKDCSNYLFDKILNDKADTYKMMMDTSRLTTKRITKGLLCNLKKIGDIDNLPLFNKVFYHIWTLILIDNNIQQIVDFNNPIYNVILWFFNKFEFCDYETLRTKFIYFNPTCQVRIIKKLFKMAEQGKMDLTIDKLNSLVRIDRNIFEDIAKYKPDIPIDISVDVVIKSLYKYSQSQSFFYDKEIYDVMILNAELNNGKYKRYNFKIGSFFDKCQGRVYYTPKITSTIIPYKTGIIKSNKNQYEITIFPYIKEKVQLNINGQIVTRWNLHNDYFDDILSNIKALPQRKYNPETKVWIVPKQSDEVILEIKEKYNLAWDFEISKENTTEIVPTISEFEWNKVGQRNGITFCEGRPTSVQGENGMPFYWCANEKCFEQQVVEHNYTQWRKYTLYDFCRILGLNTDTTDTKGRFVKKGNYLAFVSTVNRMNYMLKHLYCRSCGELLEPAEIANFLTHLVTKFKCTKEGCKEFGNVYYISRCYNGKCNDVIDQRDTQQCSNGMYICPKCGSCCSNRVAQERINRCNELNISPSLHLLNIVNQKLGHLEKREFYCYQCGKLMSKPNKDKEVFKCTTDEVEYNRNKYDYELIKPNSKC